MKYKDINFVAATFLNIVVLFMLTSCDAQPLKEPAAKKVNASGNAINWMSFEEAVKKSDANPKKIFIDVYTDWCGWCKKMDASTFMEDTVINYLNKNYYAVKLNAETKDTIRFRGKEFKFMPEYKSNELAISLLGGKMGYPSYVLLDEKYTMLTAPVQSYLNKEDLMPILVYYGDEFNKTKTWEEYQEIRKPKN
jgi:thioredoxin-related protein